MSARFSQKKSIPLLVLLTLSMFSCTKEGSQNQIAPLLEGMGDHHYQITTNNELAQRFFNQGLILSYGFNHREAERSFLEAARLDSTSAMAYWGAALVLGPNINAPMDPADNPKVIEYLEKANKFAFSATEKEQALINALNSRYLVAPPDDRSSLDSAYASEMRLVYNQYPDDVDLAALFAESLMDEHPWDYWEKKGDVKSWTPEILTVLEKAMADNPNHPGANHFYIHAVEASATPERGLKAANALREVVPGAGHLVHMPSHIYIRTGLYHEGTLANERALKSDNEYVTQCHAQGVYPITYMPHNAHFLWATATLEGASQKAIDAAILTHNQTDTMMMRQPGMGTLQHFYVIPLYAYVRFGKWEEILNYPAPAEDLIYPRGIWHYARGVAFTRTGDYQNAEKELEMVNSLGADPVLNNVSIWGINGTVELLQIASKALAGEIAAKQGDYDTAILLLQEAIDLESSLNYNEPPDWFFPVRHSLGAILIESDKAVEAEEVYRNDLIIYPENGWSLFGLKTSLKMQGKDAEAAKIELRLMEAWAWADINLTSSRF